MSEDVTSLHLSYDHHLKPWLESFAFIDRSSNTYLGVQQRYEIGGGLKWEEECGFVSRSRKNKHKEFKKWIKKLKNKSGTDILDKLKTKKEDGFKEIEFFYKLIKNRVKYFPFAKNFPA